MYPSGITSGDPIVSLNDHTMNLHPHYMLYSYRNLVLMCDYRRNIPHQSIAWSYIPYHISGAYYQTYQILIFYSISILPSLWPIQPCCKMEGIMLPCTVLLIFLATLVCLIVVMPIFGVPRAI